MDVEISRWRRYGHDRLYVSVDGRKLGHHDLTTGEDHPADATDAVLLAALVRRHLKDGAPPASLVEVRGRPAPEPRNPVPVQADSGWRDLADNRPGKEARERAEEEWSRRRAERPVRAVLGRLLNVHTDERAWRIGADGEEAVGEQLDKLVRNDPRWRVLHAVPVGDRGSDIDHLLIGPAGVFSINTKHHPDARIWVGKDQLRVDGHPQPYIRNSRFEAARVATLLASACGFDVRADALIIMWGVADIVVRTPPGEKDGAAVHVMHRRQAVRWLRRRPAVLSNDQVAAIHEKARRSTTWI